MSRRDWTAAVKAPLRVRIIRAMATNRDDGADAVSVEDVRAAIARLAAAYEEAADVLDRLERTDPRAAYDTVRDLVETLQKLTEQAATLRAEFVGRTWEREKLSLAGLAERIGVSRSRADQLIRARKAAHERERAERFERENKEL